MSDFKREERYIVIKVKDLNYASAENKLLRVLQDAGIPTRRCVVVEADWPEYETVWKMIEARCSGRPSEIAALAAQVEKLTKERDEALERERNCAIATHRQAYCIQQCASIIGPDTSATIDGLPKAVKRVTEKLAALAEQNEKMRVALQAMVDEAFARNCGLKIADDALSLPDLTSPALNRIRAEGMRTAAEICARLTTPTKLSDPGRSWLIGTLDCEKAIHARADELENPK